MKLWLVVILATAVCRQQNEAKKEIHGGKQELFAGYAFDYPRMPPIEIKFDDNPEQLVLRSGMSSDYGGSALLVSREEPQFTVTGDTVCYEVSVGSIPFSGIRR